MAEMKYKIGDRVIAGMSNIGNEYVGQIGVIVDIDPLYSFPYSVDFDGDGGIWCKVQGLVDTTDKIVITHDGKTTTASLVHPDGTKETATANCAPEDKFDFMVGAKLAMERLAAKVNDATVVVDGFKVGDRVNVGGMNGTVICITMGDTLGVQFDDENYQGHRCLGIKLKAGSPSTKCNCWWVSTPMANHGEAIKYYNGSVVCINSGNVPECLTVGKVYKFVDGMCTSDAGNWITSRPIVDCDDLNNLFDSATKVKFIPVVE